MPGLLASAVIQLMKMMQKISFILTKMEQIAVNFLISGPQTGLVIWHLLQVSDFRGNKALGIQTWA